MQRSGFFLQIWEARSQRGVNESASVGIVQIPKRRFHLQLRLDTSGWLSSWPDKLVVRVVLLIFISQSYHSAILVESMKRAHASAIPMLTECLTTP